MKAMILAAGYGTRLGALTRDTPKCLMPLGERVILDYVIENLRKAGITSVVVNLHYLADKVRAHFQKRDNYGLEVHFSEEASILGTGGGILNARRWLDQEEDFVVHNADVYSELDLLALIASHRAEHNAATLAVMERETKRPLLFSSDGQLTGWQGSNGEATRIATPAEECRRGFTGIHVISKTLWPYLSSRGGEFSIISVYMEAAKQLRVRAFDMTNVQWIDIGSKTDLERLQAYLKCDPTP